ncbi:MAG: hypothetical protein OXE78_04930 [Gammaproteobacteria bacterium]|nr:hypothetical protein [Gammaproteobacteria bacterium]MCY4356469.1 hypothetical protein [Gammaproteobacteria bacterium]
MTSGNIDMQCWKCGQLLRNLLLPFSRQEVCEHCQADLHVCLACRYYDPGLANACREDHADFVLDKDRANFCDYFSVNTQAFRPHDDAEARAARAELARIFGEEPPPNVAKGKQPEPLSEADQALAELKRLFGDK